MYSYEPRRASSNWAGRIVNRDNLWLVAMQKEADGDISGAILAYLSDATECVKSHNLPRAALSCSSAALCLEKTGNERLARSLYQESATLYEEFSHESLSWSIRESLWSLQRAYENYVLARDEEGANNAYFLFESLAAKVNPFTGRRAIAELSKYQQMVEAHPTRQIASQPLAHHDECMKKIRELLVTRKSLARLAAIDHNSSDERPLS